MLLLSKHYSAPAKQLFRDQDESLKSEKRAKQKRLEIGYIRYSYERSEMLAHILMEIIVRSAIGKPPADSRFMNIPNRMEPHAWHERANSAKLVILLWNLWCILQNALM